MRAYFLDFFFKYANKTKSNPDQELLQCSDIINPDLFAGVGELDTSTLDKIRHRIRYVDQIPRYNNPALFAWVGGLVAAVAVRAHRVSVLRDLNIHGQGEVIIEYF